MSEHDNDNDRIYSIYTTGEMNEARRASFWKGFAIGALFMLGTMLVVGLVMGV